MRDLQVIPLMPGSSGSGWATREMGTAFTMGGVSYLPWLVGSLEECPGEGYWLSFNQRLLLHSDSEGIQMWPGKEGQGLGTRPANSY